MHASFILQVTDPRRDGDRKAECIFCHFRYIIFTGTKLKLDAKNIMR